MSALGALLGRIFSRGSEVELMGGLNFTGGLVATPNEATESVDVSLDASVRNGFRGVYYVDPLATAAELGSEYAPFHSTAAAFAYATTLGVTRALLLLPPDVNLIENVVYPSNGGDWEIACSGSSGLGTITGTITCNITSNSVGAARVRLTNLHVTGAVAGDCHSFTVIFEATRVSFDSAVTLSSTGGGAWFAYAAGRGAQSLNNLSGRFAAVTVAGPLFANAYALSGAVDLTNSGARVTFSDCRITTSSITFRAPTASSLILRDCFIGNCTITGVTSAVDVSLDGTSITDALANTLILSGTATLRTRSSNFSRLIALTNNLPTTGMGNAPAGLYRLSHDITQLVAGTGGAMQLNAVYTDMTGTLVTVASGSTLAVNAAAGTKTSGALTFHHNGASAISITVTGVTTAGALSASLLAVLQMIN